MKKQLPSLKQIFSAALFILLTFTTSAQMVSIVSAQLNVYNVSPRSLCQVSIMSPTVGILVYMQAQLTDAANNNLLTVTTNPFSLRSGINVTANENLTLSSVQYGTSSIVGTMKNTNILPSGNYKYCVKLMAASGTKDIMGDQYCDELQSDVNTYLNLVSPADGDTINSPFPTLVWTHSEPFSSLTPGESFRMLVVPMQKGQSAAEAVTVNTPLFLRNNLLENQVQYPTDARSLEMGKHYGWQVQLLSAGAIINQTEAWEFILDKHVEPVDNKYAKVKRKMEGGAYQAVNNRIFFRFDEAYAAKAENVKCTILDTRMKPLSSKIQDAVSGQIAVKKSGFNQYEVDLKGSNIQRGYYYLQISNGKEQDFMLKFQIK